MSCESILKALDLVRSQREDASRSWGASFCPYILRNILISFAVLIPCLLSAPVYAHKVNMFAYVEANKVMMEGYFSDGKKPINCEVVVTDTDEKVLVKGVTDHDGKFSFVIPELTNLHIVLNAGMGHRAEYVISQSELSGGGSVAAPSTTNQQDIQTSSTEESPISSSFNESSLRRAVIEANLPLLRSIEELKESAKFSNIIGGVGFIFGIVGVLFYIKARKMLDKSGTRNPAGK